MFGKWDATQWASICDFSFLCRARHKMYFNIFSSKTACVKNWGFLNFVQFSRPIFFWWGGGCPACPKSSRPVSQKSKLDPFGSSEPLWRTPLDPIILFFLFPNAAWRFAADVVRSHIIPPNLIQNRLCCLMASYSSVSSPASSVGALSSASGGFTDLYSGPRVVSMVVCPLVILSGGNFTNHLCMKSRNTFVYFFDSTFSLFFFGWKLAQMRNKKRQEPQEFQGRKGLSPQCFTFYFYMFPWTAFWFL